MDIVVFPLPQSCTQLHDCDSSLVGVGVPETVFEENARMVYCCWPEAMDRDACQEEQQGRLILDSAKFTGTHKTISIPGDGMLAAFLYDTAQITNTNLEQGTYGLIIANCNYQDGRQIHVTGGVHWTPKLDDTPGQLDYHTLHEQYHDGGIQDHSEYQGNHVESAGTTEEPVAEEPVAEEAEEEGTIDETLVLMPPGTDEETPTVEEPPIDESVELVPPGADEGDGTEPFSTDDDTEATELTTESESQIVEEPQEETDDDDDDEPGGIGLIAAMAGAMVLAAVAIIGIIYYQYRRKRNHTPDALDPLYDMDEGGARPSIDDEVEDQALLTPKAHRDYRRPNYMDEPHHKHKSRPVLTKLSHRL